MSRLVTSGQALGALSWLSLKTWACAGAIHFYMTENGDVGVFEGDSEKALGTGNTASEALDDAHAQYHKTPGLEKCDCVILELDGDALP